MNVFISWSGERSREYAEELRNWLPGVLQYTKPYFTPDDIEKGSRWNSELANELEISHVGIFCITKDNINSPWINFEAGALSKRIDKSLVIPILFAIDSTELEGPLIQFQYAQFAKQEIKKVIDTINNASGDNKLESAVLSNVFNKWWQELNERIRIIIDKPDTSYKKKRTDRDLLEELLKLSRISQVRGQIDDEIVQDLMEALIRTHDSIAEGKSQLEMMENLRKFQSPINNLIRYVRWTTDSIGRYTTQDRLNNLRFDTNF